MATRTDMMLMHALSQFGAGLGQHMSRRRQGKRDDEFAKAQFPEIPDMQTQASPEVGQLMGAMMGGMPGGQGAAQAATMATSGMMQKQTDAQIAAANAKNAKMREAMKDPRMAAMIKQAHVASMMPKPPKITSVSGGFVVQGGNGQEYEYVKTNKDGKPKDRYLTFKNSVLDLEQLDEGGSPTAVFTAPPGTSITEVGKGEDKIKVLVNDETGDIIKELGGKYEFGKSQVTTKDGTANAPSTVNAIQSSLLDSNQSREALGRISDGFEEKFLEVPYQAWDWVRSGIIKVGGKSALPKSQLEDHGKAATFYQDTWTAVNEHIRRITGAQMNQSEVPRLMKSIANTTDDSVQFMAKLDNSIKIADEVDKMMRIHLEENKILDPVAYNKALDVWGDRYTKGSPESKANIERDAREKAAGSWAAKEITYRWIAADLMSEEDAASAAPGAAGVPDNWIPQ